MRDKLLLNTDLISVVKLKEMIYSYYTNEFLLTMDDFNDLVGNESKGSNNFQKKINFNCYFENYFKKRINELFSSTSNFKKRNLTHYKD